MSVSSDGTAPIGADGTAARAPPESFPSDLAKDLVAERPRGGWFTRVVAFYLRRYEARRQHQAAIQIDKERVSEVAHAKILRACIKSALSGAASGIVSTAATLFTAETEGAGALLALPVAVLSIGGEMLYRSYVHLELTATLAEVFGVHFDPNDPDDLWRIYALVFKAHDEKASHEDPGKALVGEVIEVEGAEVGEKIGSKVLEESVARNIVPFVGILSSGVTNFVVTRRLGHTVRRYMRYQRAMHDAFELTTVACHSNLDLLIEGMWFIFTADGRLAPEETATLARLLDKLDPVARKAVEARFVEDELDWADRIESIPQASRVPFLHALEVAACVDKDVSLPERKILRRAAHHLGLEFDLDHLKNMIEEFESYGVLTKKTKHRRFARSE
jgi:uncharacterized tellurite resistance protein B-like protein